MGNKLSERLSLLLKTIKMDQQELATKIKKDKTTIYRILANDSSPTKSTIQAIADATGCSYDWLKYGTGDMLLQRKSNESSEPWRDEAFAALKEEVKYLREMLKLAVSGKKANFLKALDVARVSGEESYSGAAA